MADSKSNALEVTVTELSGKLKRTVEDTFGHVRVRGEISGYRGPHSSGHSYFSLKDERARLEAVIWRGQAAKLKHLPEEGLEVIASGKLTTYPGSSKYQIVIDNLEPAGAGALMALLEERRKKLAAEGLFDEGRKQLLPFMPKVIGVVTSPTGAVIRDVLHRIADRFPVHVLIWPVRVQGDSSGSEVANGVHRLNTLPEDGDIPRPDLIIVARGGGSLEDLWGFNDEVLARAAAGSMIPLISAVGHETDWTLIDHAADWRAPTPTAAAEKAVPVKADLEATLADLGARLRGSISRLMEKRRNDVRSVSRGLKSPDLLLSLPRRQFDEASGRLGRALGARVVLARTRFSQTSGRLSTQTLQRLSLAAREKLSRLSSAHDRLLINLVGQRRERFTAVSRQIRLAPLERRLQHNRTALDGFGRQLGARFSDCLATNSQRLNRNSRLLASLSYHSVLQRGFAVLRDESDAPLTSAKAVSIGARLSIEMQDGRIAALAEGDAAKPAMKSRKPKKGGGTKPLENQGNLF